MTAVSLTGGWRLAELPSPPSAGEAPHPAPDLEWLETEAPGDVHSTLLRHGRIEDPFVGDNAEKCRWVEEKTWWYRTALTPPPEILAMERRTLVFQGLDTFATVYLNGAILGVHENMFTPAVFDVTEKLCAGENVLDVVFTPAIAKTDAYEAHPMYDRMWYSYSRNRAWMRKAQMNTRWDWGPRIVTAGIWRKVILEAYSGPRLTEQFLWTESVTSGEARISARIRAEVPKDGRKLTAEFILSGGGRQFRTAAPVENGAAALSLTASNPILWWTNGLGDAYLYDAEIRLLDGETLLDSRREPFGIRTLEVRTRDGEGNARFLFVLNGVELFAKGANWIPAHSFLGAVRDEDYREWTALARKANMNMLRVWGGGVYESPAFYDACDQNGILVWQDFMFACSSYPDFDEGFMENVKREVVWAVRELRNHPCLALWCGNNEIQWIHTQKLIDLEDTRLYGEKIFHQLMPRLLADLDPTRLYWPSSPFGGEDPNSDEWGDKHNWQVWAGQVYPHKPGEPMIQDDSPAGISFRHFSHDLCRFCSEFGMHAAPEMETLRSCIPEGQLYYGSYLLRYRNRDKRPDRGVMLMEDYTGQPADLEQYIAYSMLAQAEGLKFGVEHYRRRFPACGGALIWQLNDCWPALSWSVVDFYRRPKGAYFYVRRAFAPILLSFQDDGGDSVSLWCVNDGPEPYRDTLEVRLMDFYGNVEFQSAVTADVPAGASMRAAQFSKNRMNVSYQNFEVLSVRAESAAVEGNHYYFKPYKDLNLPPCELTLTCTPLGDGRQRLEVATDVLARFVRLRCSEQNAVFSDNYFDLLPGEQNAVLLQNAPPEAKITVTALNASKRDGGQGWVNAPGNRCGKTASVNR